MADVTSGLLPIGSVVAVGERRYVVAGHRIAPVGELMGAAYVLVPYPLGFVGPQSVAVVPASVVGEAAHTGFASEEGAAYLAEFAALAEAVSVPAAEYEASERLLSDFAQSESDAIDTCYGWQRSRMPTITGINGTEESPTTPHHPRSHTPLPIGSVVRLAGGDALVMVLGFEPELDDLTADYLGVPYPMGLATDDGALAFDAEAVAEVVHAGLWDEEAEAGLAAARRWRAATDDAQARVRALIDSLTPERFAELRERYALDAFEALEDEPEPDFPDE